jgi:hypothetical protein
MSMCRLNPVAKARKSPGTCAVCHQTIEAGEAYGWWQGRYTRKQVAHKSCHVPAWMRETNATRQEHMRAAEAVETAMGAETAEEATAALKEALELAQGVVDTLEERLSGWQGTGLENSGQYEACSNTSAELEEWLSQAYGWADDLEALPEPPTEPEGYGDMTKVGYIDATDYEVTLTDWEQAFDEAQGAIEELPELDLGA